MIKKILLAFIILLGLGTTFTSTAQSESGNQALDNQASTDVNPFAWMTAPGGDAPGSNTVANTNMFDPMSWMAMMSGQSGASNMNLARPEGWAIFMNPGTYPALMDPATYGQFMNPGFYMQFANPGNLMSWMNPASYGAFMNPATYMQMMNPMAYMQFMNPNTYMQWMNPGNYNAFMNPNTYMQWMNPASYAIADQDSSASFNWFDPSAWAQTITPAQQ